MIVFKDLSIRNFLSIGNVTQALHLDQNTLTLVLGENLDVVGRSSRNGCGKSAVVSAISYALYGSSIANIRKDNLINLTNAKNMLVSLSFIVNNVEYKIERGRRPNVLKFYIGEVEQNPNVIQGDVKDTQDSIEKVLGMGLEMFKHIIALNTYTEPFLTLPAGSQRLIIEQLLGIVQLSERSDLLKECIKETKGKIAQEEYKLSAIREANRRIEQQIELVIQKQNEWLTKQFDQTLKLKNAINDLSHINIETELQNHKLLSEWKEKSKNIRDTKKSIDLCKTEISKCRTQHTRLEGEIKSLVAHKCYACGQNIHDDKQSEVLSIKKKQLEEIDTSSYKLDQELLNYTKLLDDIGILGNEPTTFYSTIEDAYQHKGNLTALEKELETLQNVNDPYVEQIINMKDQAIQEISLDVMNDLTMIKEHQDFLLKLLTSKDSFIRKKIIDQSLLYLNTRLTSYLEKMGLPHTVYFHNDLSVSIEDLGRELDFHNLSRGERNRLNISLSLAFRDVWEAMNVPINLLFIDEMIDSGLDANGVESALEILKNLYRSRNKSVWLISHRDELVGRVPDVMYVRKENGFTSVIDASDI